MMVSLKVRVRDASSIVAALREVGGEENETLANELNAQYIPQIGRRPMYIPYALLVIVVILLILYLFT